MGIRINALDDITIAASADTSGTVATADLRDFRSICIVAPGTLTNAAINIEVSNDNTTWAVLQSSGSDVTIAAAKALVITDIPFGYLRLKGSGNEASLRTFTISGAVPDGRKVS